MTGAGSGLGAAAARLLASEGAKVGLLSRTASELEKLAQEISAAGGEAMVLPADISKMEEMTAAVEQLEARWSRLDIVFANAGVNGVWAPLDELSLEDWDHTLGINLRGTFITVKSAFAALKKQGGSVIVTSSVNGNRMFSNTGATAYACSKAGQVAFTKMLAPELACFGIRINVICPGAIDTKIDENTDRRDLEHIRLPIEFPEGQIPLTGKTPGTSEQVAKLVAFLASDESSHITGTEIYIDGGQSLLQG
ncbi:MAG: SDR family oxidoreductase [Verrucomicrobiaceae bacterium]|nr:MAG: SDR family oxidoreductase [Verrucomicrobiaceae bacterium]